MRVHTHTHTHTNTRTQTHAYMHTFRCVALGNFAYGDAGEAATTAGGGIGAILGAINTHTTDAKLVEEVSE